MLNHKNTRAHHQTDNTPLHSRALWLIVLAVCIAPIPVTAAVYKWVDAEGKTHYGSQRPEDAEAEKMKIDTREPYREPGTEKDKKEQEGKPGEQKGDKKAEPEAAKPAPPEEPKLSKKEKMRLCDQARKRVATIESRGRLKGTDEQGNVRHLTDAERLDRLKKAREDVAEYCR